MTDLNTRRLGNSQLEITPVGLGTAPIGSTPEWKVYWGPQDEKAALRAIQAAIDLGVNWIDTAPFYGWGRAEQIVGQAIQGRRDRVYVFTKCGTLRDGDGWFETLKPASIRREVEASLRYLQTDTIDLYQFHDPDPKTPIEASWMEMQKLIQEGKVRYAGLSNHPRELVERAAAIAPVTALQHPYSILARDVEQDILPYAKRHQVGVLAWGTLAHGFLTDGFSLQHLDANDFRHRHPYAQGEQFQQIQRLQGALGAIARVHGKTIAATAVAWALMQPALTGAIIGVRNPQEARAMTDGVGWKLFPEELQSIDDALAA
jgi:aryl-alcohol dehydrogenase-like predicted oxidoreductase